MDAKTPSTDITIDTGTDELLCVIRDRVAIITLNRPEVRNALSDNLTPALRTMIKTCGENPQVGALLITGAGTAFCAGGDVKGMGAHRDQKKLEMSYDEKVADLQERQRLLTGALTSVRKPTIAALPGPAVGAGLAIAMACDLRIAAQSAFISTGYLRVGLSGDYGIAWLLTRLVGTSRARELMFTADKVDARRAEAIVSATTPAYAGSSKPATSARSSSTSGAGATPTGRKASPSPWSPSTAARSWAT